MTSPDIIMESYGMSPGDPPVSSTWSRPTAWALTSTLAPGLGRRVKNIDIGQALLYYSKEDSILIVHTQSLYSNRFPDIDPGKY